VWLLVFGKSELQLQRVSSTKLCEPKSQAVLLEPKVANKELLRPKLRKQSIH
jgi:hypothetical protein